MHKYRSFCTCFGVNKGEELIERFYNVLKYQIQSGEAMAHKENAAFGLLLTYTDTQQLEARILQIDNALNAVLPAMKLYFGAGVYLAQPGERDVEQLYNNAMIAFEMLIIRDIWISPQCQHGNCQFTGDSDFCFFSGNTSTSYGNSIAEIS